MSRRHSVGLAMAAAALLGVSSTARAQSDAVRQSSADGRREVTITVYNQNFALVREIRRVALGTGLLDLEFRDVASSIQPETVHITSLAGPSALRVLEQNYQYDLLSPQKLLEKYVGRSIRVYRWNPETEREEVVDAEVLAVNGGPVLRVGNEITYNFPGRLAFPELPANLIARPTLMWRLESQVTSQDLEVSYLTQSLNWKADYVLVLDTTERLGNLTGWVTLTNQSGATFEDAQLKLVAGDVQRVSDQERMEAMVMAARGREADPAFREESLFEYHLYTLGRPTTLRHNEQKQVTLLESDGIGLQKEYEFSASPSYYRQALGPRQRLSDKVGVFLQIDNTRENGLGMALPRGIIRVYKADESGAQQFVGEDRIDHTPREERVRIRLGDAFDVVGERRQIEYRVISNCVSESAWEISIRNRKDEDIAVRLVERAGGDWTIVRASHDLARIDATSFGGVVEVPVGREVVVEYLVRVRWC